jgi:hypothetical protein
LLFGRRTRTPAEAAADVLDSARQQGRRDDYRERRRLELEGAVQLPPPGPGIPAWEVAATKAKTRKAKVKAILSKPVPKAPPREAKPRVARASTLQMMASEEPGRVITRVTGQYSGRHPDCSFCGEKACVVDGLCACCGV